MSYGQHKTDAPITKALIVYDGDAFKTNEKIIRLFGIDTPELHNQYLNFEKTSGLEYIYAQKAKEFTIKFIMNKSIKIHKEGNDLYNRTIARVSYQEDLGLSLLRNGLARVAFISIDIKNPFYTKNYEYYHQLLKAQYQAFKDNVGIWKNFKLFKSIFPKAK